MKMMLSSVLCQIVNNTVNLECAVCNSVGNPAHCGPKVGIVIIQVVIDVVKPQGNIVADPVFVRYLWKNLKNLKINTLASVGCFSSGVVE